MLINSSQSAFDNLKQLMVYVGITWATALINTSLPALENIFSFHPTNFLWSFSLILLKVFLFFSPPKKVTPNISHVVLLLGLRIFAISPLGLHLVCYG